MVVVWVRLLGGLAPAWSQMRLNMMPIDEGFTAVPVAETKKVLRSGNWCLV